MREMHAAAADGSIYGATAGGGPLRIDSENMTRYTTRNGLPTARIWTFEEDGAGGLWIATHGGGVVRWRNGAVHERITTREGLPNDFVRPAARCGRHVVDRHGWRRRRRVARRRVRSRPTTAGPAISFARSIAIHTAVSGSAPTARSALARRCARRCLPPRKGSRAPSSRARAGPRILALGRHDRRSRAHARHAIPSYTRKEGLAVDGTRRFSRIATEPPGPAPARRPCSTPRRATAVPWMGRLSTNSATATTNSIRIVSTPSLSGAHGPLSKSLSNLVHRACKWPASRWTADDAVHSLRVWNRGF